MAQTQKMYLGGVPVIKNYFGENPIVAAGAYVLAPLTLEILVVGGGAGGGKGDGATARGGGGGAGRFVTGSIVISAGDTFNITVGANGVGATSSAAAGTDGVVSTLIANSTTYNAPGGGGGGTRNVSQFIRNGRNGGSGGGGSSAGLGSRSNGGTAQNGSPIIGQGANGVSVPDTSDGNTSGAGGGAGYTWIDGITYCFGGANSGGAAATYFGGGGAGNIGNGGNGKGGMVRIAYPGPNILASGGVPYSVNGYIVHYYNTAGSGSFTYPL